jgi:DNA repair exonuclease SbcCD ATPase subunit/DNA repair exonuclease SbcCD nuclease subunit
LSFLTTTTTTTTTTSLHSTPVGGAWQEGDDVMVLVVQQQQQQQQHSPNAGRGAVNTVDDSVPELAAANVVEDESKTMAATMENSFRRMQRGVVRQNRGRGWYSVQILDSGETIKCRSTQLRSLTAPGGTAAAAEQKNVKRSSPLVTTNTSKTTLANNGDDAETTSDALMKASSDEIDPIVVAPPPPTMINLDAAVDQALFRGGGGGGGGVDILNTENSSSNDQMNTSSRHRNIDDDVVEMPRDVQLLQQVAHFKKFQKWVVFTDLHCAPSTLDTCLQVLNTVHELALQRNAAVLFLGDFWHHRGTLRVDCLNAVLSHFKSVWTVPMVLIPGNHDQVTLGGHDHSLTPLENAYRVNVNNATVVDSSEAATSTTLPGPLIFSHPTMFANALFVPHIRDNAVMESVLQSDLAKQASALFVHADVKGAFMNDLIPSLHGVAPSIFPSNKNIYSGHFHKPHVVVKGRVCIEYLGSPFEISLAEAQQNKSLYVLDASQDWKIVERIPINLGRKHFRPISVDDFHSLQPAAATTHPTNACSISNSVSSSYQTQSMAGPLIQPGDRIVFSIKKDEIEEIRRSAKKAGNNSNIVDGHAQLLRKSGASVEIREVKDLPLEAFGNNKTSEQQARELEEMSLESTWRAFLEEQVLRDAYSNATANELLDLGLEALRELETDESLHPRSMNEVTNLQLSAITVEGFGPFREKFTYPLLDRGLVLLRGINKDGGSDSNGSGKSSLAMAALWALTGSVDPRPLEDSKVSDVVNDSSKVARVSVRGSLNGVEFVITRTKTPTKAGGLTFFLGGEDLSTQTAKETQELIEESLGVSPSILARTMFHGQHSLNELLEASDAKLKDELSLVVPLATWQAAVAESRKKMRDADKRAAELQGMLSIRSDDFDLIRRRLELAESELETAERHFEKTNAMLQASIADLGGAEGADVQPIDDFDELEKSLMEASHLAADVELELKSWVGERDKNLLRSQQEVEKASSSLATATADWQSAQLQVDKAKFRYDTVKERVDALGETWGVEFSADSPTSVSLPPVCPTCHQPISEDDAGHDHSTIRQSIERDVQNARRALDEAEVALKDADRVLQATEQRRKEAEAQVRANKVILQMGSTEWNKSIEELEEKLARARAQKEEKSSHLSDRAKFVGRQSKIESIQATIRDEEANLEQAQSKVDFVQTEYSDCEELLKKLRCKQDDEIAMSKMMKSLAEALGQRGVQTFVLQNAVTSLQTAAQLFLDDLSDGSQRLQLSLDAGDRISRRAWIRCADGSYVERPLASLSGGQWRRCSLALQLGFADWVARRGKLRPSFCVLDEPLTHLDRSGRAEVGRVLRKLVHQSKPTSSSGLHVSTMLLILQDLAAEELEEAFDCIDDVVKKDGCSSVFVDDGNEDNM